METTDQNVTTTPGDQWIAENKDQVIAWRAKYGELSIVHIGGRVAVIRKPMLLDFERALMAKAAKGAKPLDYQRSLLGGCGLYVDPELKDEGAWETALLLEMGVLAEVEDAVVEKF